MSNASDIAARLERLERLMIETRLPPDQIVGAEYVAEMFGISPESVIRGRFGTDLIPRVRQKPVGFRKGDVHKVLREHNKTAKEKADEFYRKGIPVRRKG